MELPSPSRRALPSASPSSPPHQPQHLHLRSPTQTSSPQRQDTLASSGQIQQPLGAVQGHGSQQLQPPHSPSPTRGSPQAYNGQPHCSQPEINYEEDNYPLISQEMQLQPPQPSFYAQNPSYQPQQHPPQPEDYRSDDPFQTQNLDIDNEPLLSQSLPDPIAFPNDPEPHYSPQKTPPRPSGIHTIPEVTEPDCSFLKSNPPAEQPFQLGEQPFQLGQPTYEESEATQTNLLQYANSANMREEHPAPALQEEEEKENIPVYVEHPAQESFSLSDSSKQYQSEPAPHRPHPDPYQQPAPTHIDQIASTHIDQRASTHIDQRASTHFDQPAPIHIFQPAASDYPQADPAQHFYQAQPVPDQPIYVLEQQNSFEPPSAGEEQFQSGHAGSQQMETVYPQQQAAHQYEQTGSNDHRPSPDQIPPDQMHPNLHCEIDQSSHYQQQPQLADPLLEDHPIHIQPIAPNQTSYPLHQADRLCEEQTIPYTVHKPMEIEFVTPLDHHRKHHMDQFCQQATPSNEQEVSPRKEQKERSQIFQNSPHSESRGSSRHEYVVAISNCKENSTSHVKNNDIYGIAKQQVAQPVECRDEREVGEVREVGEEREVREQREVREERENNHREDSYREDSHREDSRTHSKSKEGQVGEVDVRLGEVKEEEDLQKQEYISERLAGPQPSLDKTIEQLQTVLDCPDNDSAKFKTGSRILEPHVDLLLLRATSPLGHPFLSDGKLALLLVRLMLLKQEQDAPRRLLEKYLFATLSSKITENRQVFEAGRRSHTCSVSLEVSFKKERHEPSSDNDSLFVHDGSAIRDLRSNMDIDDPNEQPLKRTVAARTPRSPHESQTVSPHSGRPNKTKQRSNKKGVTSRKVHIKDKPSEAKPKSASKGGQLKDLGDPSAKGQQLGSKFTFATLTHGPYHMKEVVQVRVSQRILEKKTVKQTQQTQQADPDSKDSSFQLRPSRRKSLRKSTSSNKPNQSSKSKGENASKGKGKGDNASKRRSAKLLNFQDDSDLLSIDYLKDHCKQIKLCLDLSEDRALTDRDKEFAKYMREFASLKKQTEQMTEPQRHQLARELATSHSPTHPSLHQQSNQIAHPQSHEQTHAQIHQDREKSGSETYSNTAQRVVRLRREMAQYKVQSLPVEFKRVVDPDINGHGIYALLELTRSCHVVLGARYALTPITNLELANKRLIEQDLASAKAQVGEEADNLAYVQLSAALLRRVQQERRKRQS